MHIRGDLLLGDINLSGGAVISITLADSVNLVVDRGSVMVTLLTGTGNSPLDVGRMPSTDTSDLSETLVGLTGKLLGAPTLGDTAETVTAGNGNDVNNLVLLEDGVDGDGLLEEVLAESNLVGDGTTVELDLHEMGLLLLEGGLSDLSVSEDTDNGAVLLDALELAGDGGTLVLGVLLGVLGESLLLALVPVLVESALELVTQMLGPDSGKGSEASGGLDVAHKTNNDHLEDVSHRHKAKRAALFVQVGYQRWKLPQQLPSCSPSRRVGRGHERWWSYQPCNPWRRSGGRASWGHPWGSCCSIDQPLFSRIGDPKNRSKVFFPLTT